MCSKHPTPSRMKLHGNAPLGPKGRAIMVKKVLEDGLTLMEAAEPPE